MDKRQSISISEANMRARYGYVYDKKLGRSVARFVSPRREYLPMGRKRVGTLREARNLQVAFGRSYQGYQTGKKFMSQTTLAGNVRNYSGSHR